MRQLGRTRNENKVVQIPNKNLSLLGYKAYTSPLLPVLLNNRGFKTLPYLNFFLASSWSAANCEGVIQTCPFQHRLQKISLEITILYVVLVMEYHLDGLCCVPVGYYAHSRGPTSLRHLPPATYPRRKCKTFFSSSLALDPHHRLDPQTLSFNPGWKNFFFHPVNSGCFLSLFSFVHFPWSTQRG